MTQASSELPTSHMLVVDDDPAILKLVKHLLTRGQYQVTTCESGNRAVGLIQENLYDCIITDALMPEMSGYDLIKVVRQTEGYANIPIIMLTRKRERSDVKMAMDAGVTDYVLKPIDGHLFLDKLELSLKKTAGKRQIFQHNIEELQRPASIHFNCKIISISESDFTLRVPSELSSEIPFHFRSLVFDDIGLKDPLIKLSSCKKAQDTINGDLPYEAQFSFVGAPETDLQKIRTWLHREGIKRRK